MPGILPMKVIKVGTTAQPRIAQACDRCRSKKIRCDGIRPSCTQCLNVGFECKTSDKLSRRAFPRGYTESLEERVRALESEVRELKDLLDEKDEKIDILSRIRSHNPPPAKPSKKNGTLERSSADNGKSEKEDSNEGPLLKIVQPSRLISDGQSGSYLVGLSSTGPLINAFKRKLKSNKKNSISVDVDSFLEPESTQTQNSVVTTWSTPARMVSDQLVNIYFQEFAPLFPILHRPTFLRLYDDFMTSREPLEDIVSLAQLNLVFGIAALSNPIKSTELASFESQWQAALNTIIMDDSLGSLQCLALAQLFCLLKGDYSRLLKYRGISVGLSQRLGLQQSQKHHNFGPLVAETRKRVFWTLYTLDAFVAAQLGLPTLYHDSNVHCELPVDADDEYVTENDFLSTLPGESTKLSAALALFKLARVLSRTLDGIYRTSACFEVSLQQIGTLQDELDEWSNQLPSHLRLQFEKDKPSTGVISSRSPILSLAYHFTQTLVARPAILATTSQKSDSNSAVLKVASSFKCIIQIMDLLIERNMAFTFCLNRDDLLLQATFGLLIQSAELGHDSAVSRDNIKLSKSAIAMISSDAGRKASDLQELVQRLAKDGSKGAALKRHNSDGATDNYGNTQSKDSHRQSLKVLASRLTSPFSKSNGRPEIKSRRSGEHALTSTSQSSLRSESSETQNFGQTNLLARSEPALSPPMHRSKLSGEQGRDKSMNLDYLNFSNGVSTNGLNVPLALAKSDEASSPADWERLLSSLDNGRSTIYDSIYGGQQPPSLGDFSSMSSGSPDAALTNSTENLHEPQLTSNGAFGDNHLGIADGLGVNGSWSPTNVWAAAPESYVHQTAISQSVLSFGSDEGEEWTDAGAMRGGNEDDGAIIIPGINSPVLMSATEGNLYSSLDVAFGL